MVCFCSFLFYPMTFVVKKYLAQTEEIKTVVEHLNDAGISEYVFTKRDDPFRGIKKVTPKFNILNMKMSRICMSVHKSRHQSMKPT